MRILLSAFACEPNRGSEPGVGWNIAWHLAVSHQVHVLTRRGSEGVIESYLKENPNPNIKFSYHDPFWGRYVRWSMPIAWNLYYAWWQLRIATWAKPIDEFKPDVIHHITYMRYWMPSSLAWRPEPFIFGPVGGGDNTPRGFSHTYPLAGRLMEKVRCLVRAISEFTPLTRKAIRGADAVLASPAMCEERVIALGAKNVSVMCDTGVREDEIWTDESSGWESLSSASRFVSCGRLLHWKGVHLSIRAFAACGLDDGTLEIYGDGPVEAWLKTLTCSLDLGNRVRFRGSVDRKTMLQAYRGATALLHPSLHESGGTVCVEALAAGLPVLALRTGGPAVIVDEKTGFLVEPTKPKQAIDELATAMHRLAREPGLRSRLSAAGPERVRQYFTWNAKVELFEKIYRRVLTKS